MVYVCLDAHNRLKNLTTYSGIARIKADLESDMWTLGDPISMLFYSVDNWNLEENHDVEYFGCWHLRCMLGDVGYNWTTRKVWCLRVLSGS